MNNVNISNVMIPKHIIKIKEFDWTFYLPYEESIRECFKIVKKTIMKDIEKESEQQNYMLKVLKKFNICEDGIPNFVVYCLPFWVAHDFNKLNEEAKLFCIGNIYGMMYYSIMDDIIDGDINKDDLQNALLATSYFYNKYLHYYTKQLRYITNFTISIFFNCLTTLNIKWQNSHYLKIDNNVNQIESIYMMRVAPLLLNVLAMNNFEQNDLVNMIIDDLNTTFIIMQIMDDVSDLESDIQNKTATIITNKLMELSNVNSIEDLNKINTNQYYLELLLFALKHIENKIDKISHREIKRCMINTKEKLINYIYEIIEGQPRIEEFPLVINDGENYENK